MSGSRWLRRAAPVLVLAAAAAGPAAARTLYWQELAVQARLDADGGLHVLERQRMVFDGAWNGGERVFRLPAGQRLDFHTLSRLDPEGGGAVALERGDLDRVDRYDWVGRGRLRWRSRLPSDPPFDDTVLVYELGYTYSGVVWRLGEEIYRLSHDFAFSDRAGSIERFTLVLELDPAWQVVEGPPELRSLESGGAGRRYQLRLDDLPPGEGVPVRLEMRHAGATAPAAVQRPVPPLLRAAIIAAALAGLALMLRGFLAFERRQGRYEAAAAPLAPDEGWVRENVLHLRPEVAGALWDQSIGRGEVTALLARLVAEGKLASSVRGEGRRQVMELELLVARDRFEGYERELIDKLFFGGRTRTDTEEVRSHYKSEGFSPAATISPGLGARLREVEGFGAQLPGPSWKPPLLLLLASALCLLAEGITRGSLAVAPVISLLLLVTVLPAVVAWVSAWVYRKRATRLAGPAVGFLLPLAVLSGLTLAAVAVIGDRISLDPNSTQGLFALLGMALLPPAVAGATFNIARTRDSRAAVAKRKQLAAVRDRFRHELRSLSPALRDEWFPYLLAFGLQRDVDRWSVSYRSVAPEAAGQHAWTGGGTAFATSGSTRAWSTAAGGMAAGVSPPSSSGSSGGGGGGSFSGGGGGGGW